MKLPFTKVLLIISLALFVGSFLYRVYVYGNLSSMGIEIRDLERESAKLEKENNYLKEEVASASSLLTVKDLALKNGMVENSSSDFLISLSASSVNANNLPSKF